MALSRLILRHRSFSVLIIGIKNVFPIFFPWNSPVPINPPEKLINYRADSFHFIAPLTIHLQYKQTFIKSSVMVNNRPHFGQ